EFFLLELICFLQIVLLLRIETEVPAIIIAIPFGDFLPKTITIIFEALTVAVPCACFRVIGIGIWPEIIKVIFIVKSLSDPVSNYIEKIDNLLKQVQARIGSTWSARRTHAGDVCLDR